MLCDVKFVESLLSQGLGGSNWILSLCGVPGPSTIHAQWVLGDLYRETAWLEGWGGLTLDLFALASVHKS